MTGAEILPFIPKQQYLSHSAWSPCRCTLCLLSLQSPVFGLHPIARVPKIRFGSFNLELHLLVVSYSIGGTTQWSRPRRVFVFVWPMCAYLQQSKKSYKYSKKFPCNMSQRVMRFACESEIKYGGKAFGLCKM